MAVSQQRLTLEDFLQLPEEEPSLEFEEGRVTQKVSPKVQHSMVQVALSGFLNSFTRPRKLAIAFTELRTTYSGRSYVPDISVYRWDRIPKTAQGKVASDFRAPPDIAVEIVSPGQSTNALVRRCLWHVENGVGVALLIDPADESVLVFRPGSRPSAVGGAGRIDIEDLLPGFPLTAQELFDSLKLE